MGYKIGVEAKLKEFKISLEQNRDGWFIFAPKGKVFAFDGTHCAFFGNDDYYELDMYESAFEILSYGILDCDAQGCAFCSTQEYYGKFIYRIYYTDGSLETRVKGTLMPLEEAQAAVGGYIEFTYLGTRMLCVNEEGVLKGLPQNPFFPHLCGNVIEGYWN